MSRQNPTDRAAMPAPGHPALGDSVSGLPSGFRLLPRFIGTQMQMSVLLDWIDSQPWDFGLRRGVQHYGWRYDYRSRSVMASDHLGPLPEPLAALAASVAQVAGGQNGGQARFDQAIVNAYEPGQGIADHVDCRPCFGPVIASLSLGDEWPMRFTHPVHQQSFELWLPAGSLLILSGPARYDWTHGIAARKTDAVDGQRRVRQRRISVTLRQVITKGPIPEPSNPSQQKGTIHF